ncbi:MAG: site-specific integrase [Planctomycetes bacterium]|nr:site-specific integrase [Planctomycetota bacterium]
MNVRAITHAGRTQSLKAWADETGIPSSTIAARLGAGWDAGRALTARPNRKFGRGGRKPLGAPRPVPALKVHPDGRHFCRWHEAGKYHWRYFDRDAARAGAEYKRFAAEWVAAGGPPVGARETVSVARVVALWLAHCAATYRKRGRVTSEVYCCTAATGPLVDLYGDTPAAEFGAPRLAAVREAMVARKWVRRSVNGHVGRLVRMFAWAAALKYVPAPVHQELTCLAPLVAERRADLSESEAVPPAPAADVEAVLTGGHLHERPARRAVLEALVRLQLMTGMRPGEACALTAAVIDRARDPWRAELSGHKVAHKDIARVVFFGPRARALLAPLLPAAGAGLLFMLPPYREGARAVPVTTTSYRKFVARACAAAGVPVWTPNQLRHTRATELMDAVEDDAAVAAALGNTPEVARQVYAARAGETVARRIAEATG